jgi:GDPmannose 4,6-dehydratase
VIATGKTHSIREFIVHACEALDIKTRWTGEGLDEMCLELASGSPMVKVNPEFYRPAEVDYLIGDASLAAAVLNWRPKISFKELVKRMVDCDCK